MICKGRGQCGKPCKILLSFKKYQPKINLEFCGSAPEIFVGRHNYPDVFAGILSPNEYGNTQNLSMPEIWFSEDYSVEEIMRSRSRMVYARFEGNIKKKNRFTEVMQEVALASKPVATEFKLKKKPSASFSLDSHSAIIGNPAPLQSARLEENPKVEKKADYVSSDYDLHAVNAINELYTSGIEVSNIIKILSAGLIGLKSKRKMVPSRWAITATDDTISKSLLENIRNYRQIQQFLLFNSEYLGNHYEIILMPREFNFEVIEAKMQGSVWNPSTDSEIFVMQDYELFNGRKEYASNVTGAYYANRLAICEYLKGIKRQASCLVMREVRQEYWAPCGVGILREASRNAFAKQPEKFQTLDEALDAAQKRLILPVSFFAERSKVIQHFKKQKRLFDFA
ncbi:MAG: hypothetical protein V1660_01170 [archaeon]